MKKKYLKPVMESYNEEEFLSDDVRASSSC